MPLLIFLARMPTQNLIALGAFLGLLVVALSFANWRLAVKSALIVLLFEGALRKWILPSGQELIYFLKDGILLGAYIRFYMFPDPDIRAYKIGYSTNAMLLLIAVISFSALNPNINAALLALYGIKIYFYYIPLAFMIPYLYRSEEALMRGLRRYALLATPICLIGALQFAMPGSSIWNVYAGTGADTVASNFGGGDGVLSKVRITGTFSYLTGHTTFCIFFTAIHVALLMNRQSKLWFAILIINLGLLVGNAMMGGSRACVAVVGMTIVVYAVLSLGKAVGTSKSPFFVIVIAVIGIFSTGGYVFYSAWQSWSSRAAVASDSLQSRLIGHTAFAMSRAFEDAGLFGYGIGTAHPATEQLRNVLQLSRQLKPTPSYDHEMGQVYVELGMIGFLAWYGLRILTTFRMYQMIRLTRPGIVKSLIIGITFLSIMHLYFLQVVFNHAAAMLLWAGFGVSLIPSLRPAVIQRRRPN